MSQISKEITDYSESELEVYLQNLVKAYEVSVHKYAETKAQYEELEDKKKSVLAASMLEQEPKCSLKQQENAALDSDEFKNYLKGLSEARKSFLIAQATHDTNRLKIDVLRTILATRREVIKNFRG